MTDLGINRTKAAARQTGMQRVTGHGGIFSRVHRAGRVAVAAAVLLAMAGPAAGQNISPTVYYPDDVPPGSGAGTSITLSPIYVRASVGGRCGFAEGQTLAWSINQPDFDATGFNGNFNFVLNCTGPANVAVVSANGGMFQNVSLPSGYTNKAPYDVGLNLVGNNGVQASASCEAAALISGSSSCTLAYGGTGGPQLNFTGPADADHGLTLPGPATNGAPSTLIVKANPYAGAAVLASGAYQDVLTLTVHAAN